MAEVLVQFSDPVVGEGRIFVARACGHETPDGLWQAWIEFLPADGGDALRTGRETTQPNRNDDLYWATGLTAVYLEGALQRALRPLTRPSADPPIPPPVFDEPAGEPLPSPPAPESILNPFSVYRKGEGLLRRQLAALAPRHLANIVQAHGLSDLDAASLARLTAPELIELIVTGVQIQVEATSRK